jgi:hypothetical protein
MNTGTPTITASISHATSRVPKSAETVSVETFPDICACMRPPSARDAGAQSRMRFLPESSAAWQLREDAGDP